MLEEIISSDLEIRFILQGGIACPSFSIESLSSLTINSQHVVDSAKHFTAPPNNCT